MVIVMNYISAQLMVTVLYLKYLISVGFSLLDSLIYFHNKVDRLFVLCSFMSKDHHGILEPRKQLLFLRPYVQCKYFGLIDQTKMRWHKTLRENKWASSYLARAIFLADTLQKLDDRISMS